MKTGAKYDAFRKKNKIKLFITCYFDEFVI